MPHIYNWSHNGLIREFSGTVTGSEIIGSNFEIHGDLRFDGINYVMNDFSNIDDCIIVEDELHILSVSDEVATHANSRLKIAIIATRSDTIELARVYCDLMRQATYDAALFSNLDDAQTWGNSTER